MASCQRRLANSGSDNVNQEHDHHDVILEGLGLHQIEEHMECLEATGCEALRQEMESLIVMIAASNAVLELPIRMGMFNKWCYCVPPIYDEEQEDH